MPPEPPFNVSESVSITRFPFTVPRDEKSPGRRGPASDSFDAVNNTSTLAKIQGKTAFKRSIWPVTELHCKNAKGNEVSLWKDICLNQVETYDAGAKFF